MAILGTFTQQPAEVLDYDIDFSQWLPEADYVVITAGGFDALVEVVCEDDNALLDLVNKKIRTLPGVLRTETFVYLKLNKQTYTWGTR